MSSWPWGQLETHPKGFQKGNREHSDPKELLKREYGSLGMQRSLKCKVGPGANLKQLPRGSKKEIGTPRIPKRFKKRKSIYLEGAKRNSGEKTEYFIPAVGCHRNSHTDAKEFEVSSGPWGQLQTLPKGFQKREIGTPRTPRSSNKGLGIPREPKAFPKENRDPSGCKGV